MFEDLWQEHTILTYQAPKLKMAHLSCPQGRKGDKMHDLCSATDYYPPNENTGMQTFASRKFYLAALQVNLVTSGVNIGDGDGLRKLRLSERKGLYNLVS